MSKNNSNTPQLTEKQINVVRDMHKHFGKAKKFASRTELLAFTRETYGKKSDSTFLTAAGDTYKVKGDATGEAQWGKYIIPNLDGTIPANAPVIKTKPATVAGAVKTPKTLSMTTDAIRKRAAAAKKAKNAIVAPVTEGETVSA